MYLSLFLAAKYALKEWVNLWKWIFLIVIEAILTNFFGLFFQINPDLYSMFFIVLNSSIFIVLLLQEKIDRPVFYSILSLYFIKVLWLIFMYFDIDATVTIFKQWDVYTFNQEAVDFKSGIQYPTMQFYSKIVGTCYIIFGENMQIPVYFNILFSTYTGVIFYKILKYLKIEQRNVYVFLFIYLLLPWKNLLSLYLLREAIPSFFVMLSLFYFIQWLHEKEIRFFYRAILTIGLSLPFHSGLVPVLLGYIVFYCFYNTRAEKFILSHHLIIRSMILCLLGIIVCVFLGDVLFFKFSLAGGMSDEELYAWSVKWTEEIDTGSLYLTWLQFNNLTELLLQSPLRGFYFLYSPLPWDFRDVRDLAAFAMDSMIQIIGMFILIKNWKYVLGKNKLLLKLLCLIFIATSLVFGIGTFESGTALRHRAKFISILFLMSAIAYDAAYKRKWKT